MPEMFHTVDILGGFDKIYSEKPEAYIVCTVGAYQEASPLIMKFEDFKYLVNAWYQHPHFRNKIIYFTACMKKTFFWDIGGVYEKYASGVGHEDTSFRFRVFDSGVEIITPEELLIIHQAHESTGQLFGRERDVELTARNLKMAREEIPAAWFRNEHTPSNWWRNQKLKEKEK
jgi:GT2 family glycosyltransferase